MTNNNYLDLLMYSSIAALALYLIHNLQESLKSRAYAPIKKDQKLNNKKQR